MSSEQTAITAKDLSKCYHVYESPRDRLKQFLWRGRRHFYREFWALHPINLSAKKGECIGYVGRNGSGKSTLLQLLAGTLSATGGSFAVSGRVAALLELGAGFNPEFTGRENVYLNGAIVGLSHQEISDRFESIAAFAEIGDFIDQPVKTYSSGMYVRLAFSVAIHVDPQVLLVDEALAVGDAPFQYKCMRKLEELRARGMTIIFVTHDIGAVKRLCDRAGWLHEGRLIEFGSAVSVADKYEDFTRRQSVSSQVQVVPAAVEQNGTGAGASTDAIHAHFVKAELLDAHGAPTATLVTGNRARVKLRYQVLVSPPKGLVVGAAIYRSDQLYVCGLNTALDEHQIPSAPGEHEVILEYPALPLLPGSYYFKMGIFDHSASVIWDFKHATNEFTVVSPYRAEGVVLIDHTWSNVR